MTAIRPSVFALPGVPTLADALMAMKERKIFSAARKRELEEDMLIACEWLGLSPDNIVASAANLNPRFRALTPANLMETRVKRRSAKRGVSKKRVANVKSSVKTVVECLAPMNGRSFKAELTEEWKQLINSIPDRYRRVTVMCLAQYASANSVLSEDFGEEASLAVLQALERERFRGNPRVTHQNSTRCWNWCVDHVPRWPQTRLIVPRYSAYYILPWTAFQPELVAAIKRFMHVGTTANAFDLTRKMKSWRPSTVKTYDVNLRRYLSLAALSGFDVSSLRSLEPVLAIEVVEKAIDVLSERNPDGRGLATAAAIVLLLSQVARNPEGKRVLTDEEVAKNNALSSSLGEIAARLKKEHSLSPKTRKRLVPLKDDANLGELFLLPFAIEREVVRSKRSRRRLALLVQWALALMIVTFCPLRISTLTSLSSRHIVWSRPNMRGELSFEFEEGELKNGEPASMPLPNEVARLLRLYLEKYRHLLVQGQTEYLFPGSSAVKSKTPGTMATQLSKLIKSRTGFVVNMHLYRHLVHIVILRRFPGAYAMIARVLTHKSIETAIRNYSYFDVELSMRAYQQLVRDIQSGRNAAVPPSPLGRGMYSLGKEDRS